MMADRDYLGGVPHPPDARSWEAFHEDWPVPDGTEYLGRACDDHEDAHDDDGWESPFAYSGTAFALRAGDNPYQRLMKTIDLARTVDNDSDMVIPAYAGRYTALATNGQPVYRVALNTVAFVLTCPIKNETVTLMHKALADFAGATTDNYEKTFAALMLLAQKARQHANTIVTALSADDGGDWPTGVIVAAREAWLPCAPTRADGPRAAAGTSGDLAQQLATAISSLVPSAPSTAADEEDDEPPSTFIPPWATEGDTSCPLAGSVAPTCNDVGKLRVDDADPQGGLHTQANAVLKDAAHTSNREAAPCHELHVRAAACAPRTHREGTSLAGSTQIWLAQEQDRGLRWRRAKHLIPRMRFKRQDVYERFELNPVEHSTLRQLASMKGQGTSQFKSNAAAATLRLVDNYQRALLDVANSMTYLDSIIASAIDEGFIDFGNNEGITDPRAQELSFAFQTAKNVLRFQTNELSMRGQHDVATELSKLTNALGVASQPPNIMPVGQAPQPTPTTEVAAQKTARKKINALNKAGNAANPGWKKSAKAKRGNRGNRKRGRSDGGQGNGKQPRYSDHPADGGQGGKGKGPTQTHGPATRGWATAASDRSGRRRCWSQGR